MTDKKTKPGTAQQIFAITTEEEIAVEGCTTLEEVLAKASETLDRRAQTVKHNRKRIHELAADWAELTAAVAEPSLDGFDEQPVATNGRA